MHTQNRKQRPSFRRGADIAITAGLSLALVTGSAPTAYAATATTELDRLASRVESATATYRDASAQAAELQQQIDAMADEILTLEQETLPAQRAAASQAASNLYKMRSGSANIVSMLLGAESFGDFITLTKYLGTVEQDNIDALEDLNDMQSKMEEQLKALSEAKDEATAHQATAAAALDDARTAHAAMAERVSASESSEEDRAKVEAAQDSIDQAVSESPAPESPAAPPAAESTPDDDTGQSEQIPSQPEPDSGATDNSGGNQGGDTDSGWLSGVASYYGIGDGFMGGTTASGEIVTETSMGIAMLNVPFGTRVEIRYGGRSVVAYVNDRGPYVHGRVIDMQPAVARALGFISVGVGTVQYRFL